MTSGSDLESERFVSIITILNSIIVGILIFASSKAAFYFLEKRMEVENESEATRRMHQKFNQRTIFQVTSLVFSHAYLPTALA